MWNPFESRSWAQALGLAYAPMFGSGSDRSGNYSVLLDGRRSSFALLIGDDHRELMHGHNPLSWQWSSYLNATLVLSSGTQEAIIRDWASPNDFQRVRVPEDSQEAWELCAKLSTRNRSSRVQDVVSRMIYAFKHLRAILSSYQSTNLQVVQAFNLLLELSGRDAQIETCRTLSDAASLGTDFELPEYDLAPLADARIEDAVAAIVESGSSVTKLFPDLLIRHASGHLYQEAHFELERAAETQLSLFGGLQPNPTGKGKMKRDARFTPPELARSLTEQALAQLANPLPDSLEVLDPACGSGVFLQSVLMELINRDYRGTVILRGFDESDISVEIARFCLRQTLKDCLGIKVQVDIQQANALNTQWDTPDVILMNPPFTRWRDMTRIEQDQVAAILGDLRVGHADKSMAFVKLASQSVVQGGTVATVIPSTMLDGSQGEKWRGDLLESCELRSIARFNGYGYFLGAIVEPAYVVFVRLPAPSAPLTVLIAGSGCEDISLREVRRRERFSNVESDDVLLLTDADRSNVTSTSWLPRTFRYSTLLRELEYHPTVEQLFDIRQGALTGKNDVFVLHHEDYHANIRENERQYFRPAASTSTIRSGRILELQYVFFPYEQNGPIWATEEEVRRDVPHYYEHRLGPSKDRLKSRSEIGDHWWRLTRERDYEWQSSPKLVTAYFGDAGSFAYDDRGRFVCLHGYMWKWNGGEITITTDEDKPENVLFEDTDVPWGYLAILNSSVFEFMLSCFCARVQGGQFNLSIRYVKNIPIPDLVGGNVPGDVINELVQIGVVMASGRDFDQARLDNIAGRAYGIPFDRWLT